MSAEKCPYGKPRPEARLVPIQGLKHEGALAIHRQPLRVGGIVGEYRPLLEGVFGVAQREPDSRHEAYVRQQVELSLYGMIVRMYGYRAIPFHYLDIAQVLDDADAGRNATPGSWAPVEGYILAPNIKKNIENSPPAAGLKRVIEQTQNTFTDSEQAAISATFTGLAHSARAATGRRLDFDYPGWRELDPGILENIYDSDLPEDKMRLLSELDIETDLHATLMQGVLSAVPSTVTTLSELHTALADAGCPEDERWAISYANLRKLSIFAQIPMTESERILSGLLEPEHPNMFTVTQAYNGLWHVDFTDDYLQKVYNRFDVAKCQGATEIYPLDKPALEMMRRVHNRISQRAGNNPMDIQFDGTTSAAEMGTLLVTAYAERDKVNLIRH